MARVILVSNRVATLVEGKPSAGGLAVAVVDALQGEPCLWMGWNGHVGRSQDENCSEPGHIGSIQTMTWPLSQRHYDGFYRGFSNSVLWPAFHYRLDHMRFDHEDYQSYLRVNQQFAQRLAEQIMPEDVIWVHDYHFIHVASFCRMLGIRHRIGFFLHIPFPNPGILSAIPVHRELMRALSAYDVVGFQTSSDVQAFHQYFEYGSDTKLAWVTKTAPRVVSASLRFSSDHLRKPPKIGAYPISIDYACTIKALQAAQNKKGLGQLQRQCGNNPLIISVERLDYTKGIAERLKGYEYFLQSHPARRGKVCFIQISPPSRTDVHGYSQIRQQVEQLTSQINGKWAEPFWTPINYINRSFDRPTLLALFRRCRIGLVTSLRDGMNLVSKEFVAVQSQEDPGVLILSEFAGAAQELRVGALLVNPYDRNAIAAAIEQALSMSLEERQDRLIAMQQVLQQNDLQTWKRNFLADLRNQSPAINTRLSRWRQSRVQSI